ncbi:MAG: efflux RND transporter periplasmic adaptor subunit, partial [Arenicellales bacterium]
VGELDQANTQLAVYNAEKNLLDIRIGYFLIKAPFSGIVTERFVNKGDAVSAQQHLLTLSNHQSLVAKVQVSESALSSLTKSMPATIIIPSSGANYTGKISRIYPKLHPNTRQATVEITFDEIPEKLFSGQSVLAEIKGVRKNRILVPLSALKRDGDGEHVFLLKDDGKAHRQAVISSSYIAGKVEITQGIKNNDKIITRGFLGLSNGKAVKVSGENSELPNTKQAVTKTEQVKKPESSPTKSLGKTWDRIWNKVLDIIKS